MSVDQATALIQAKGLVVESVEVPSDKAKGVVIYQDVAGDTWVDQGSKVTLKVSSGQKQQTSYKMSIPVPKFYTGEIEILATLNGETVKSSNLYAADIDNWPLSLSGNGVAKLVIRIDGNVYQAYNVDFDGQTHTLLQDRTEELEAGLDIDSSSDMSDPEYPID